MKIRRRTALLGIAATAAFAAPQSPAPQAKDKGADKDRVADAERAFAASLAKRDIAAFESHLSSEAVFFGGPDGSQVARGKRAVVAAWAGLFQGPNAPFSWAPDQVEVLDSGTLALSTGPVKNPRGEVTGRFMSIWRLESDGQWHVIFDRGCPVCKA